MNEQELEQELRRALSRVEPEQDFSEMSYSPKPARFWMRSRGMLALAAALVIMLLVPIGVLQYQARQRKARRGGSSSVAHGPSLHRQQAAEDEADGGAAIEQEKQYMRRYVAMAVLAFAPLGIAQELRLPVFDKLKEKASDVTNLTLNKNLLQLGVGFLGNDKDAAKIKKLVEGLNGIFVKSLEFDKEGAYTKADLQQLLSEVGGPGWNLIISSDENHGQEISRIWIKTSGKR